MLFQIVRAIFFFPILLVYPTIFKNRKKIPKGKVILLSNHLSNMDPVLITYKTARKYYILAKKELFKTKLSNWFFNGMGAIKIDREKTDLTAIKESLKVLKNNKALLMFPEGTRNKESTDLQEIKNGSAMLAIKAKAPIVPVHIVKRPRPFVFNKIVYGDPFYLDEFYDKKLDKETLGKAAEIIAEKLKANSEEYTKKEKTSKK